MKSHIFKKQFGQNFLSRDVWAKRLVSTANIGQDDTVIEIGAGKGIVTNELLQLAKKVIVFEIDRDLIPFLLTKFAENKNLELINQDILQANLQELLRNTKYKVVSSLPYNISKKIISLFLESNNPPELMSFIIQKEVGEDYASIAPKASFLGVYSQLLSEVNTHLVIPRGAFTPQPKVAGIVISFKPNNDYKNKEALIKFVKSAFAQPRKTLINNLKNLGYESIKLSQVYEKLNLQLTMRPQELTIKQWENLFSAVHE